MENNEIINVQMTKEVFETLGSGGNGGNGGGSIEYYDISTVDSEVKTSIAMFSVVVKGIINNNWAIHSPIMFVITSKKISYIGINRNQIIAINNEKITIGEAIKMEGLSSYFSDDNKISKEQFYDLTLPTE